MLVFLDWFDSLVLLSFLGLGFVSLGALWLGLWFVYFLISPTFWHSLYTPCVLGAPFFVLLIYLLIYL